MISLLQDFKEDENPEEKSRRHKELEVCDVMIFCSKLFEPTLTLFISLQLKPLYKELLYTIAHKMGRPSSVEAFTDTQLHQYIQEVNLSVSHTLLHQVYD